MLTIAPKGTKDVLPDEVYKWHYVERAFADICERYGFREIRTPDFEHTELFKRGVGDTTDIVQKEMYTWEQAKRSLTLRPEGTSPVVRAFVEHKLYAEAQPSKYYYNIPCFRYEKPQSGRRRSPDHPRRYATCPRENGLPAPIPPARDATIRSLSDEPQAHAIQGAS